MADNDPRISAIRTALDAALSAVSALSEEGRQRDPATFARLQAALGFASVTVDATDPLLITDDWQAGLVREAGLIAESPTEAATDSSFGDDLLAAATCLPVARGRDVEQAVKDAAVTYQRSIAQRVSALESRITGTKTILESLNKDMEEARQEFTAAVDDAGIALQTRTGLPPVWLIPDV